MAVHLLTGDDESLLSSAVGDLVRSLVGDGDRSLMVDEFEGEEYELRLVVDAAQTPPFLTDRRVVVARGVGRFRNDDLAPLLGYLALPLDSTDLVLTVAGGRPLKALADAVGAAGGSATSTAAPSGKKDRVVWIEEQLIAAGLKLDVSAMATVVDWLGEEAGRLHGVLDTLASTYGTDRRLSSADIVPFLGQSGGVPPWDLTDAIDRGDVAGALGLMTRMMRAGERHPLQLMAILHSHYVKLARLDGADARGEADAQRLLGVKSGFQARKALDQYARLGRGGVNRAVQLLAQADLDLRGTKDWPAELVMEVLVARLARLVPAAGRGGSPRRG